MLRIFLVTIAVAQAQPSNVGTRLMSQSWEKPLTFDNGLENYFMSASTIPTRDNVVIAPGLPGKYGIMFHKEPILTTNFEVEFSFMQHGNPNANDQAFAFWYTQDNIQVTYQENEFLKERDWHKSAKILGFDNGFGYKRKYRGFGALFTNNRFPQVSGMYNGGEGIVSYKSGVPGKPLAFNYRSGKRIDVKIRFQPDMITAWIKDVAAPDWVLFYREAKPVEAGGYLGWTAYTGNGAEQIRLDRVSVMNYDPRMGGEKVDASMQTLEELLHADTITHGEQIKVLNELTASIEKHLKAGKKKEQSMLKQVMDMQANSKSLHDKARNFAAELRYVDTKGSGLQGLVNDVNNVKNMFLKTNHEHRQALEEIHEKVEMTRVDQNIFDTHNKVNTLNYQSDDIKKTVHAHSNRTSWLLFILICCAGATGVGIFQRMKYYEKKHFL